jgi:chemotaxis signal transduction protein
VTGLRNVVTFTVGTTRLAVELRWVREITPLGFVTEVPTAPPAVAGVYSLHGTLVPVLDLGVLRSHAAPTPARQGRDAIVVEVEGVSYALAIDALHDIASLEGSDTQVTDARGNLLPLISPWDLVQAATASLLAGSSGPAARTSAPGTRRLT